MGKKKINSKKHTYNGITFQSGLEVDFYKKLKKSNLPLEYEPKSYEIIEGSKLPDNIIHYKPWGKGFIQSKAEIHSTVYTPDFVYEDDYKSIFVECKGRANERYPLVKKMFFLSLMKVKGKKIWFFEPKNQKQNTAVIEKLNDIFNGQHS